ncbi:MAG: FtsX-like permease family protein [Candidatus Bathyarchaeia archaeon]
MNPAELFRMAYSALSERKLRTSLTILMVIIGASLITSLNGLNAGTSSFISDQLSTLGGNVIIISPSSFSGVFNPSQGTGETKLNAQTVKTVKSIRGVSYAVPYYQGLVTIVSGGESKAVTLVGMDNTKLKHVAPKVEVLEGAFLSESDSIGIVLGYAIARKEGGQIFAKLGQTVVVELSKVESSGPYQRVVTKRKSFQVKGILSELGNMLIDNQVYVSLPAAAALLEKGGEYSGIYLITRDPSLNDEVVERIKGIYGKNIGVTSPKAIAETINRILGTFNAYIQSIAAISLLVGAVGIVTTLFTSVMERTREIGLLKALGFSNETILALFLTESSVIGLTGGLMGVIAGVGGAFLLTALTPFGEGISINPVFKAGDIAYVWCLSITLSLIAGLYPAWRASKLSPLTALRKE